jgi:hypothetical protein
VKNNRTSKLPRRTLLGGAAACLSLPWLPSLAGPRAAHAQVDPVAHPRFLVYYIPNGVHLPLFTPSTTGTGFALPQILHLVDPDV